MSDSVRPLLVTADPDLLDDLLRLSAAAGVEPQVAHDPVAGRRRWLSAPMIVVGDELSEALLRARPLRRGGVILVGRAPAGKELWQRGLALGAEHVIVLPESENWLVKQLGEAEGDGRQAITVSVVGGRGGAGASTLAAALALTAMRRGLRTLLLDADPLGGGIDLVLGGEDAAGLRWPDLHAARGRVGGGALRDVLPQVDELAVLTWDRGDLLTIPAEAMTTVLAAGQQGHDLVVVDAPRRLDEAASEAVARSDVTLLLVPAEVRAAAAASRVVAALEPVSPDVRVVVRGPAPSGLPADVVASSLGLPLLAEMEREPGIEALLERGEPPCRRGRSPLARFCAEFLDQFLPVAGEGVGMSGARTSGAQEGGARTSDSRTSDSRTSDSRTSDSRTGRGRTGGGRTGGLGANGFGTSGLRLGEPAGGRAGAGVGRLDGDLVDRVRARLAEAGAEPTAARVAAALRAEGRILGDAVILSVTTALRAEITGSGPLDPLLRDPAVTDVLVNGPDDVWADRGRGLERAAVAFPDEAAVRRLAQRLAAAAGRRLDEACPYVDARLPDGSRLHAVLPPISAGGTCISVRVPRRRGFTVDELVSAGSLPAEGARWLRALVDARLAFLISGGTGSGKTTLLGTLLALVDRAERMVLVEDSGELRPDHPHVVRLEARPPNLEGAGEVTVRDLVRQALRMRPDRLVVGEVRGAEVADLLAALNTGHEGGCGTLHANAAADVPARLEALGAVAGLDRAAVHSQAAAGIEALVHVVRDRSGRRRVAEICVPEREPSGLVVAVPALTFPAAGGEPVPGPGQRRLVAALRHRGITTAVAA